MRKRIAYALGMALVLAALPPFARARAEEMALGVEQVLGQLDLGELTRAAADSQWLQGGAKELLSSLARGRTVLSAEGVLGWLWAQAAGVFRSSLWRMTRLIVPALLAAAGEQICVRRGGAGKAARYAGLLMTMGF